MQKLWVSVVCLCHNQSRFVEAALCSAWHQSYPGTEIIVVDDGSADGSVDKIKAWLADKPAIPFLEIKKSVGNTKAFNRALQRVKGRYVIDLACDDVMARDRVERQVAFFERQPEEVGVIYGNAEYISAEGGFLKTHFDLGGLYPFQGDVYEKVIDTYFIPPPTMMMRKEVLDELGGYDETLAYEDFDFWVRSARRWAYAYQPDVLTQVRRLSSSKSARAYQRGDQQLLSTYRICEKIHAMNETLGERRALVRRLKYELRQSGFSGNHREFVLFYHLLRKIGHAPLPYRLLCALNKAQMDCSWLRNCYHRLRFGWFDGW